MSYDVTMVLYRPHWELVERTLLGVAAQNLPPRKVWLLLSCAGPNDDAAMQKLVEIFPLVISVVRRADNLGFAGGHNYLADMAVADGADALLVLNPDLWLTPNAMRDLTASVASVGEDRFAIHGPTVALSTRDDSEVRVGIDSEGIYWTPTRRHFDANQGAVCGAVHTPTRVAGVTGAALYATAATWSRIRSDTGFFFDPLFVAYREDAELGLRLLQLGGECWVHPVEGFLHARGSTNSVRSSDLQRYLGARNRFLIKYRLGAVVHEQMWFAALARDLVVVAAGVLREPESLKGVRDARRLRRTMRYRGRRVRSEARGRSVRLKHRLRHLDTAGGRA